MKLSKKPKIVIDTNIFISGLLYGGNPEKVLQLFRDNNIELLLSPELQHEIIDKLSRFPLSEDTINQLITLLNKKVMKVLPSEKLTLSRDPKDNMLLEIAKEAQADAIITGDKDLLVLKNIGKTAIVTPREFIENFSNNTQ